MEELLNKLIEKGWKPFGKTGINEKDGFVYMNGGKCIRLHKGVYAGNILCGGYDLRQIVSKESGLWQFVCDNHLYIYKMGENKNFIQDHFKNEYNECCYQYLWDKSCYEYYLLESALCNEEDLENFLLDNIKIS